MTPGMFDDAIKGLVWGMAGAVLMAFVAGVLYGLHC